MEIEPAAVPNGASSSFAIIDDLRDGRSMQTE
jgi:hypothetical protein